MIAALVLLVCMSAAAYMGYKAFDEMNERREGAGYYENLSAQLIHAPTSAPQPDVTKAPDMPEETAPEETTAEPTAEPEWQPRESALDFAPLLETCPDVVGWIQLEGEWLDYPVVQGEDNEYYLERLPNGYMNEAGSIMLDAANDGFFRDELSILHGHHMNHGSMFGNLDKYREDEFYQQHKSIMLYTLGGDYRIDLVAAWTLDGMEFGYPTQFESDEAFDSFIAQAEANSTFDSDVQVQRGDKLILLSTCAYNFKYARFVVLGKLIPV